MSVRNAMELKTTFSFKKVCTSWPLSDVLIRLPIKAKLDTILSISVGNAEIALEMFSLTSGSLSRSSVTASSLQGAKWLS